MGERIILLPKDLPLNASMMYCEVLSCHFVPSLLYDTWPGPEPAFGHAFGSTISLSHSFH
jgi:hypothetical protein